MVIFQSRSFLHPKDPQNPEQNQDAWRVDESRGIAVVADGVSSAIFSGIWAEILAQRVVESPPDVENKEHFAQWLAQRRKEWFDSIDTTNLTWFQKPKLAAGAFSTLIWVKLEPCPTPEPGEDDWPEHGVVEPGKKCFLVSGYALGDSCLFHIKPGRKDSPIFPGTELFRVFPLEKSSDFEASPIVLGSADLGRDSFIEFHPIRFLVQEGDWVLLATDAVSQWILRSYESGVAPYWEQFWTLSAQEWGAELDNMRETGEIRYDDSTLSILHVGDAQVPLSDSGAVGRESATEGQPVLVESEVESETAYDYAQDFLQNIECETHEAYFAPQQAEVAPDSEPIQEPPQNIAPALQNRVGHVHPRAQVRNQAPKQPRTQSKPRPSAEEQPPAFPNGVVEAPGEDRGEVRETGGQSVDWDAWIERSGRIGTQISEKAQVLREQTVQISAQMGEHISDGMNRIGEKTQEVLENAKPKLQQMFHNLMGRFHSKPVEEEDTPPPEEEKPKMTRQIDPNRRRFYRPKE
ncbi:MAG: hypothetical protein Q4D38_13610 [Planctomycetia bacterium]|nr:hypothetical protein [Planctomycetia bacterium]